MLFRNCKYLTTGCIILFAFLLLLAGLNCSHDTPFMPVKKGFSGGQDTLSPISVSIGELNDQLQGHHSLVPVTLETWFPGDSIGIAGFDLLIGYDASALTFMGADARILFDKPGNYEWEYFTYSFQPRVDCTDSCPSGLLRVVAIADQNDGPHHPLETHVPNGTVLFTLDFLISNNRELECQFLPIRFFWTECDDNTFVDDPVRHNFIANDVIDRDSETVVDTIFPGYNGPPDGCLDSLHNGLSYERAITLRGGGIDIICADSLDTRGDVNLNGMPFEVGDVMLYANYFIKGEGVFTVDRNRQIMAGDANGDGITLTVADLVYIIRKVVGDWNPRPVPPDETMTARFSTHDATLSVETPVPIGALLLVFDGAVSPTLSSPISQMSILSASENGLTRVLIYSLEHGQAIESGDILTGIGGANLISAEASDYNGFILKTDHSFPKVEGFVLFQNSPNPFSGITTIFINIPESTTIGITIHDWAGRKVYELENAYSPGLVAIRWDARNLPDGVYIAAVTAGEKKGVLYMTLCH
jgi:Secretion system C-terminal sorting domain